jgi:hypothetical protein
MSSKTHFIPALFSVVLLFSACKKNNDTDSNPTTPTAPTTNPTTTDSVVVITSNASNWRYFGTQTERYHAVTNGMFEVTSEGVKAYGQAARYGGFLVTSDSFNLNNKTVYMKWKGNDGGQFTTFVMAAVYPDSLVYSGTSNTRNFKDINNLSSPTSYNGSVVISNDTWYYTTLRVTNGGYYLSTTASGNYDILGGNIIESRAGYIPRGKVRISMRVGDPYAGTGAYVIVNELKIK